MYSPWNNHTTRHQSRVENASGHARREATAVRDAEIVAMHSRDIIQAEIARLLGLSQAAVSKIIKRETAREGPPEPEPPPSQVDTIEVKLARLQETTQAAVARLEGRA